MKNVLAMFGLLAAVMFTLTGCGGSGGGSAQTTALSGTVTFPAPSGVAKAVAAGTVAASMEIRDLSGALVTTVPLTLQSGTTSTYSYSAVNLPVGKDYVLKAATANGAMVLRALVDKAALTGATTTRNVNNVTTTALIVVEKSLNLTAGTLGGTASATQVQTASAALAQASPPATIESGITAAIAACTSTSGAATSAQAQLASLASIVTAAVAGNVDPSAFLAGTATAAKVDAVTYTVSGTTATASTAAVTTSAAGTFAAAIVQTMPKISTAAAATFTVGTAGSFAISGTGSLSVAGTLPAGITFDAASGLLSGTAAAASNGSYPLTVTATSNSLTVKQAFTLTVSPASATTSVVFTTAALSGKSFTEGQGNTLTFNANGTFTASDTSNALTWTVNSAGQVVVHNATNNTNTTVTAVSGSLSTGMKISIANSDGTTESSTMTENAAAAVGFTTAMLSGKSFTEGQSNTLTFNSNGTLIASDTTNALTWTVNSAGQIVVRNTTNNTSTTVTIVSGNVTTGFTVTMANSDGTTESSTVTPKVTTVVTGFTTAMLSGYTFTEGQSNTLKFNADGTLTASDTTDSLTWTVNSSGQVVVRNVTKNNSTTVSYVSGNPMTGATVSMANSDGTTETTTMTYKP
jgi:hypothetical protein